MIKKTIYRVIELLVRLGPSAPMDSPLTLYGSCFSSSGTTIDQPG